jgi:Ca2+-binding RTX toxin-like protein
VVCIPRRRRAAFALAAALLALFARPPGALASTADIDELGNLRYRAAPGEANHVLILAGPGLYRIVDSGATITPGDRCSTVSSQEVVCTRFGHDTVTVWAGDLDDLVAVTAFADTVVSGEDGDDVLEVTAEAANRLSGGAGDDVLKAGAGFETLIGGAGADVLNGERISDLGDGGAIVDYEDGMNPVTADVDGVADDGEVGEGDNLIGILGIIGGSGDDTLTAAWVWGGPGKGNDTLLADDTLSVRDVVGFAEGGGGDDVITSTGVDAELHGGWGHDTLTARASRFNNLVGGARSDVLIGSAGGDDLHGGPGSDTLKGRRGGDAVTGGLGDDVLVGGRGHDSLRGGRGRDTIRARDGQRDRMRGGPARDSARIDAALDRASGVEVFF